jgi:hypothetical protein
MACIEPWWVSAMRAFQAVFDAVASIVLAIPGIVYDAALATIKVADTLATLMKLSVVAGIGYLAYVLLKPEDGRRR